MAVASWHVGGVARTEAARAEVSEAVVAIVPPDHGTVVRSPEWRMFAERAASVRAACDLDLAIACGGSTCVGVTQAPALDGPLAWAALAWASPRFVASAALRDLGVPAPGLPCGAAIEAFAGDGVIAAPLPDGTEAWCAIAGDPLAGRALCGAVARARYGPPGARLSDPGLRRRTFDKSPR